MIDEKNILIQKINQIKDYCQSFFQCLEWIDRFEKNYQLSNKQIDSFSFHLMLIKINTYSDPQLAQSFPNDPFGDLTIITSQQRLNLQKAFLTIDSTYFSQINDDVRQIDMSFLHEESLIKILGSLYGLQLVVQSSSELVQLFPIIVYLGIQQYRKNIQSEILQRKELLQSLQILELGFRYKFCKEILLDYHLKNKLSALQNNKNYLQIGKISHECFNEITRLFLQNYGQQQSKILNNVMQNYFNRKNLKALPYLIENKQTKLLVIWKNYHHTNSNDLYTELSTNISQSKSVQHKSLDTIKIKQNLLKQLSVANQEKDDQINELLKKIKFLKQKIGISSEIVTTKSVFLNSNNGEISNQQLMFGQNRKKSPQYQSVMYSISAKNLFRKSISGQKTGLIYNRMGAKNMKRWL